MVEILVVDDEAAIADLVEVCLKNEGYTVYKCGSGEAALTCVARQHLDLAILDVMLPDLDGFTLCQKIREEHLFPILMLTARVEDMDKIMGLTLGADDYITKPFNPLELVARVKTQLRRYTRYNTGEAAEPRETAEHDFRGLQISRTTHKCVLFGEELALTPLEFAILWYLCEHRGQVVPSEELFEAVWGEKYMDSNNTVMSHIARLREKMHEPSRKPNADITYPADAILPLQIPEHVVAGAQGTAKILNGAGDKSGCPVVVTAAGLFCDRKLKFCFFQILH